MKETVLIDRRHPQKVLYGFYLPRVKSVLAVVGVVIFALLTATPSEALKRRPTVDSVDRCINGAGDKSCDGAICSCCYDDGCWICGDSYYNCVWDPAYRKGGKVLPGRKFGAVRPKVLPGQNAPIMRRGVDGETETPTPTAPEGQGK